MPFSKMPKSVKSSVGKNKKKQNIWMSTYESARRQGHSKESAAKIAHSVISKESIGDSEMKLSKVFSEAVLNESDILQHSPELKSLLIQEIPMLMKRAHEDLKGDRYDALMKDLDSLTQSAARAKQALQQALQSQGSRVNKKGNEPNPVKNPHVFNIKDKEI